MKKCDDGLGLRSSVVGMDVNETWIGNFVGQGIREKQR